MFTPIKRPWWGVFCFMGPDFISAPYLFFGAIMLAIGLIIPIALVFRLILVLAGIISFFGYIKLDKLSCNPKFTFFIKQPFVLFSKDKKIKLKRTHCNSYHWRWNPRFDSQSGSVVIKYGQNWIDTSGRTSITLHNKDGKLVIVTLDTAILAKPSPDQAIELYDDSENDDWTEEMKEWLEKQIIEFNTASKLEDYSEIEAKLKQFDNNYDFSVADLVWKHQFNKLGQELNGYLRDRLKVDWSKHLKYLYIISAKDVSLHYDEDPSRQ